MRIMRMAQGMNLIIDYELNSCIEGAKCENQISRKEGLKKEALLRASFSLIPQSFEGN
jgi:hypothetical protein